MKKSILLFVLLFILVLICSCSITEKPNAATGQQCVDCGMDANYMAGTGWVESLGRNAILYLCDDCYEKRMDWYEDNNRVVDDIWWE